ncbi:MAG: hypothetical protein ABSF18_04470 [Gammaproteobacteria bacterium]|jgi:hypothetical protein
MTRAKIQLYLRLLKFFEMLTYSNKSGTFYTRPALTKLGKIVEYQEDDPDLTVFFTLKSALSKVQGQFTDLNTLFDHEAITNSKFKVLLTFFQEMTQCAVQLVPMNAPLYLIEVRQTGIHLFDAKALFQAVNVSRDSLLSQGATNDNMILANDLFFAMLVFAVAIKDLDDALLKKTFGTDYNSICSWRTLPNLHMQILFWNTFLDSHQPKGNFVTEMPAYTVGFSLAVLYIAYAAYRYSQGESKPFNPNSLIFFMLLPSLLFVFFRKNHFDVRSEPKSLEETEQEIKTFGELHHQIPYAAATQKPILQQRAIALLRAAGIDETSLYDDERKYYGYNN